MPWFRKSSGGFTFIELIVSTAVIMILASAALPLARVSIRRQKEAELHQTLREVRLAIDTFKNYADQGRISTFDLQAGNEGYPSSLDQLVEGVGVANDVTGKKLKFLRRVPIDPVTGKAEWGLRAYTDASTATAWGGSSVYDIYSRPTAKGSTGPNTRTGKRHEDSQPA
jgi:general secretion pathway protein G